MHCNASAGVAKHSCMVCWFQKQTSTMSKPGHIETSQHAEHHAARPAALLQAYMLLSVQRPLQVIIAEQLTQLY
jgi:hypothetical protein